MADLIGSIFTDDFNRANSGTVGNGWAEETGSVAQILSNKLRFTGDDVNGFNQCRVIRPSTEAWADGEISVEFTHTTNGLPQIHGRIQSAASYDYYLVYINGIGSINITRVDDGNNNGLASGGLSLSYGTNYKLALIFNGSSIKSRLWDIDAGGTLLSELSATDSTYGAGMQAVSNHLWGTVDYDNFRAEKYPPVRDTGTGADAVTVVKVSLADTGTASEVVTVDQGTQVNVTDSGSASETVAIVAKDLSITDTARGLDHLFSSQFNLFLLERFDGDLSGWILNTSGGNAAISTVDNDEKLVLTDTVAGAAVSAKRFFVEPSSTYLIEFDMYAASGAVGYLELLDVDENVLAYVKCDGGAGQGTFDTDGATGSTFTWAAATYKQIVLKVDVSSNAIRCWYTVASGDGGSSWTAVSAVKSYSGTAAASIRFRTDSAATGAVRVDEVKVYTPTDFAIGDSNTAGQGYTSSGDWNPNPAHGTSRLGAYEDEAHQWPYKYGLNYGPIKWCANRGVSGNKSADIDARVTSDVIDQGAQRCILMIGTNDVLYDVPLSTIETNITSITTKLVNAGVVVAICNVPPNSYYDATQNSNKYSLNSWMQSHCVSNGFVFIDVHAAVQDDVDPDIQEAAYNAGDNIHFSNAGLQAIADAVYEAAATSKIILDLATTAEAISVAVAVSVPDSGTGADAIALIQVILTDSATGSEVASISASVPLTDGGGATEEISITSQDIHDQLLEAVNAIKAKTDMIPRLLGLCMENHVEDDIVRDGAGNKLSSVLYSYDSAASAATHDKVTGLVAKYTVTAAYSANRLTSFKVVKV